MKRLFLLLLAGVSVINLYASENEKFAIEGKPVVTLFANYGAGIGETNSKSGFNFTRCYIGYEAKFAKNLTAKVLFNIDKLDNVEDFQRVAYIKDGYVRWENDRVNVYVGIVPMMQYEFQQEFWGHRYVAKSFQGEYKYYPSADLGVVGFYKLTDWLTLDGAVTNGEGYKLLNTDNGNRYGIGAIVKPVKGLMVRLYYDFYEHSGAEDMLSQKTIATFAGYTHRYFSIGAEYNKQYNFDFVDGKNREGVSVYGSGKLCDKWSLFVRYDDGISSEKWDSRDAEYKTAGVQYILNDKIRISPNYQSRSYKNTGVNDNFFYLSAQFKL